ncbi:MAG: GIY-YIG nuclease family protein [Hyphomonadaceae bacterium]
MFFIPFGDHYWPGESGKRYHFNITLTQKGIPDTGGIYIFARRRFFFFITPLYVGKATNLTSRHHKHERWSEAFQRGATERHLMRVSSERKRKRIEEDLIRCLKPKMNDMLVPRGRNDAPRDAKLRKKWIWRRKFWAWINPFKRKAS